MTRVCYIHVWYLAVAPRTPSWNHVGTNKHRFLSDLEPMNQVRRLLSALCSLLPSTLCCSAALLRSASLSSFLFPLLLLFLFCLLISECCVEHGPFPAITPKTPLFCRR